MLCHSGLALPSEALAKLGHGIQVGNNNCVFLCTSRKCTK